MNPALTASGARCPNAAGASEPGPPGAPVPGGVYLCQVGDEISCGACCGLYNLSFADRTGIETMLEARTEAFSAVPRRIETVSDFGRKILEDIEGRQPVSGFHHCPFVGLIGEGRSRVGCLLHPLAAGNGGIDWRGLSHYGGMACRIYFCPSHEALAPAWKRIVQQTAGSWYLYGLVVTEDKLLTGIFRAIEAGIGRPLTGPDIVENPDCVRAMRTLLRLKCDWPFRPTHIPGPVNYFFKDRDRTRPPVVYPGIQRTHDSLDAVFRALGSAFDSHSALAEAEARVRAPISTIVQGITGGR